MRLSPRHSIWVTGSLPRPRLSPMSRSWRRVARPLGARRHLYVGIVPERVAYRSTSRMTGSSAGGVGSAAAATVVSAAGVDLDAGAATGVDAGAAAGGTGEHHDQDGPADDDSDQDGQRLEEFGEGHEEEVAADAAAQEDEGHDDGPGEHRGEDRLAGRRGGSM